jgi:hypothetical protein
MNTSVATQLAEIQDQEGTGFSVSENGAEAVLTLCTKNGLASITFPAAELFSATNRHDQHLVAGSYARGGWSLAESGGGERTLFLIQNPHDMRPGAGIRMRYRKALRAARAKELEYSISSVAVHDGKITTVYGVQGGFVGDVISGPDMQEYRARAEAYLLKAAN